MASVATTRLCTRACTLSAIKFTCAIHYCDQRNTHWRHYRTWGEPRYSVLCRPISILYDNEWCSSASVSVSSGSALSFEFQSVYHAQIPLCTFAVVPQAWQEPAFSLLQCIVGIRQQWNVRGLTGLDLRMINFNPGTLTVLKYFSPGPVSDVDAFFVGRSFKSWAVTQCAGIHTR